MAEREGRKPINVKGFDTTVWDKAKTAAEKRDESMAVWLARAAEAQLDREAGPMEYLPGKPDPNQGNPVSESVTARIHAYAALVDALANYRSAPGRATGTRALQRILTSLEDHVDAEGGPPKPRVTVRQPSVTHETVTIDPAIC